MKKTSAGAPAPAPAQDGDKPAATHHKGPLTLAIDIGGTGIKCAVLDEGHKPTSDFKRVLTPQPATPKAILDTIAKLAAGEGSFDRIACGFPGVIKNGVIFTAANLSPKCIGFHLQDELAKKFGKPARVANDAAVQGYAACLLYTSDAADE